MIELCVDRTVIDRLKADFAAGAAPVLVDDRLPPVFYNAPNDKFIQLVAMFVSFLRAEDETIIGQATTAALPGQNVDIHLGKSHFLR